MAAERLLRFVFAGDSRKLEQATKRANTALGKVDDSGKKTSKSLGAITTAAKGLAAGFVASKVVGFAVDARNLAVAAEEAGNKFKTVFGPGARDLGDELSALGDKAGIADSDLQNMTGTLGNVLQGLGATKSEAADFTSTIAPLAVDVASFNGEVGNAPNVLAAMTSALTGEREALKSYGIVVQEADVQQRALANSGKEAASELTLLEKATATIEIITERAGEAVGDLDRNLDSSATTQARLSAEWKEAQETLGRVLVPAFDALTEAAIAAIDKLEEFTVSVELAGVGVQSIQARFSDAAAASLDMELAVRHVNAAIDAGEKPTDAMAVALATLTAEGTLGQRSLDELAAAAGLSDRSMHAAALAAIQLARDAGVAEEDVAILERRARRLGERALPTTEEALKKSATAARSDFATAMGIAEEAAEDVEEATDDVVESLAEQRNEIKKLVSPIFALRDAEQTLAEKQAALNQLVDDGKEGTREYDDAVFDLIDAHLEFQIAAGNAKDAGDEAVDAFVRAATQAGIGADKVDDLRTSIQKYNDLGVDIKEFVFKVFGTGAKVSVSGGGSGASFKLPDFAAGSIVQARPGGTIGRIGEAGSDEAVIPLNNQGAAFMQKALGMNGNGTSGPAVINVYIGEEKIDTVVLNAQRRNGRRGRSV